MTEKWGMKIFISSSLELRKNSKKKEKFQIFTNIIKIS
jgi:hypothetical protein